MSREFKCGNCEETIPRHYPTYLVFASPGDADTLKTMPLHEYRAGVFAFCNSCFHSFAAAEFCTDHFAVAVSVSSAYHYKPTNPCRCDQCVEDAKRAFTKREG